MNHTFVKTRGESSSTKNMYKFPTAKKTHYSESFGNQTIQTKRSKLPPLSVMGEYDPIKVEEQARSHSAMMV